MTDTTAPADERAEQSAFVRAFEAHVSGKSLNVPQLVRHKEIFEAGWQARAALSAPAQEPKFDALLALADRIEVADGKPMMIAPEAAKAMREALALVKL